MSKLVLRDYQADAIEGLRTAWRNKCEAPLIVAPTGAGKSILIAECIRLAMQKPTNRVAMVTHVKELIVQNLAELRRLAPDLALQTGVLCAGLNAKETDRPITFASVQTAVNADMGRMTLAIIDEAHLIPRRSDSMYGQLLDNLREVNPRLFLVGFTATPFRMDSGSLTIGKDALFGGIAHETSLLDLIERGHLVKPVTTSDYEMSGMVKRAGEFTAESQSFALQQDIDDVIADIVDHTADKRTLIFCPRISIASEFAERLQAHGLAAATVSSADDADKRNELIAAFAAGEITHLTNVNLLTTGSNIPAIEAICLCRATASTGLYIQMVGRGLRTHPDKSQCLVRDYGGNAIRHGPLGFPEVNESGDKKAKRSPHKCKSCELIIPSYPCPECGFQPEPEEPANLKQAWTGNIVGDAPTIVEVVQSSARHWHSHRTNSNTVAVECRLMEPFELRHSVTKWLCPEHAGYARNDFDKWRRKAGLNGRSPTAVGDALDEMYAKWPAITSVSLRMPEGKRFPKVVDVQFAKDGRRFGDHGF